MPVTLDQINTLPLPQAATLLDGLYEHSPWIVEQALQQRPFPSLAALKQAVQVAAEGGIVILGVTPTQPETGYGYIQVGANAAAPSGAHAVKCFVEKPDAATAQRYLSEGSYFWNAGMFELMASVWLKALQTFRPNIANATQEAWAGKTQDGTFLRPNKSLFTCTSSESIDYAVMEKMPWKQLPHSHGPTQCRPERLGRVGSRLEGTAQRQTRQRTCGRRAHHPQPQHPGARLQQARQPGGR